MVVGVFIFNVLLDLVSFDCRCSSVVNNIAISKTMVVGVFIFNVLLDLVSFDCRCSSVVNRCLSLSTATVKSSVKELFHLRLPIHFLQRQWFSSLHSPSLSFPHFPTGSISNRSSIIHTRIRNLIDPPSLPAHRLI
ncbi:hypothetical protein L1987_11005 [Smallanthus sonchifolius]|uniref:Uncharacterized protein n=1 Tax=Smallanthus sonchifolius TaxID=185202 RepID=A0ACB9JBY5_9ASTR|nr:hypothetical protein L1987_11005 [Smallanthus sonchifolius]